MTTNILQKELEKRKLPNLFCVNEGKIIQTKEAWENIARPYWKNIVLQEEYGKMPPIIDPTVSVKKNSIDFAGKVMWEEVSFTFKRNGKTHVVPTQLIYPINKKISRFSFISISVKIVRIDICP